MRKRCNYDTSFDEPPTKRFSTAGNSPDVDIRPGTILTDISGKKWKLGKTVGTGGFGEIYLACDTISHDVKNDAQYVAKVESHTNGPLFVEINCYLRIAKSEMIEEWKQKNCIKELGMPHYVASGSHSVGESKYRFLIIKRYEQDLENIFQSKKCKFNLKTVLTISLQIIDVLEYIHSHGYVHSDIKASNILLGNKTTTVRKKKPQMSPLVSKMFIRYHGYNPIRSCKVRSTKYVTRNLRLNDHLRYAAELTNGTESEDDVDEIETKETNKRDQVYLLDYGLASKYLTSNGEHKKFGHDERKAHAGTILFCSRDAHNGVQSRRSDLECLGFNIIYWLTSNLPWSRNVEDETIVHKKKEKCMEHLEEFLSFCFSGQYPHFLLDYFKYLKTLQFEHAPNYKYCKNLFKNAFRDYGYKNNSQLDFNNLEGWGRKQKKTKCNLENFIKVKNVSQLIKRTPLRSNLPIKPILRKAIGKNKKLKQRLNWSKILMDPECIMKQAKSRERKLTECSDSAPSPCILNLDLSQLNPTAAMIEVYNRSMEKHNNSTGSSPYSKSDNGLDLIDGYTLAMTLVYNRKKEREELEQMVVQNSKGNRNKNSKRKVPINRTKKQSNSNGALSTSKLKVTKSHVVPTKKEINRKIRSTSCRRVYSLRG